MAIYYDVYGVVRMWGLCVNYLYICTCVCTYASIKKHGSLFLRFYAFIESREIERERERERKIEKRCKFDP